MIIDKQNLFSEDQALTATANSTNVIDLGNDHARNQALNEKGLLEIMCRVTTAFAGGTSLKAGLYKDDAVGMGTQALVIESAVVITASLVAGYRFTLGKLPEIDKQYLRMTYTIVGTMSAGKVTAGLILQDQTST